jgi:hypothetical protein
MACDILKSTAVHSKMKAYFLNTLLNFIALGVKGNCFFLI